MSADADVQLARGIATLLRRPLLLAQDHPQEFTEVRRNAEKIQKWFARNTGYTLRVDSELIRLFKLPPPNPDHTHPLMSRQGMPFNPHRYALLCLALAVLEREEGQIDLAGLAERIQLVAASSEAHQPIDFTERAERKSIVDVVRLLTEWGVLRLRDGDEAGFLEQHGNALYDISKDIILQLVASPRPPSSCAHPEEIRIEVYPTTDEGRIQRVRHRLLRRLLEEPVVYRQELSDEEREYLDRHQQSVTTRIREAGLCPEVRNEGIAALDPTGLLSGPSRFPGEGTVAQAALLVADLMAEIARSRSTNFVAFHEVVQLVERLRRHFGPYWRQEYATDGGTARLAEDAGALLAEFKLVQRVPDGYRILPAIARFAAGYGVVRLPRGASS